MEQIITLLSGAPFLVKLLLAYAMMVIFVIIGDRIRFKELEFVQSLKISCMVLLVAFFLYCLGWLFFRGWKVFYFITCVCGVIYVLSSIKDHIKDSLEQKAKANAKASAKSTSSYSSSSYSSSAYSSRPTYHTSSVSSPKPVASTPKPSNPAPKVVPVFLPDSKPQQPTDTPAGFSGNMTGIENKLRDGISVRLDYQLCWNRMSSALKMASKSGAKVTFYNIPRIQNNTVSNLIELAKQTPGLVCFEGNILAGFEAKALAASGACFTCDCSNGSSTLPDIAANARKSNGHITFVNCSRLNSTEIKNIKAAGGDNIEIK